eukprot:g4657.t1
MFNILARAKWARSLTSRVIGRRSRAPTLGTARNGSSYVSPYNEGIYKSPFPDISRPPYVPLADFVCHKWGQYGEKIACVDGITQEQRTFADLDKFTAAAAANLRDMGISKGDVVGIFSPNHVDFIVATLATARLGATLSMVNPLYTEYELARQMKGAGAKALFVHASAFDTAAKAVKDLSESGQSIDNIIVIGSDAVPHGAISMSEIVESESPILKTVDGVRGDDIVALPYSSGTTGLPKGTMLTHDNIVVNMLQTSVAECERFWAPDDVMISPLPMFHIYAFTVLMLQTAHTGNTLVTMMRFDLERFCQLVQEYSCARAYLVPPIILGLAKHPVVDKYDISSLKSIMCAAAPLGSDIERAAAERLGCNVKQGWGMSELSPLGTLVPDDGLKPGSGSIGPCVSNTEAKIVDVQTREFVEPGESGELLVRGPQVMRGYLNEPDKTAECLDADGWLSTGDIARADEDGYFYIVDRLKELIKYKGFQVAPAELEDLLTSNEHVSDAVVIPVPDDDAGEIPRAYVVLREAGAMEPDALIEWVGTRVAPHKKLRGGVVFVDSVPKTASGKILRREVVALDRAAGGN